MFADGQGRGRLVKTGIRVFLIRDLMQRVAMPSYKTIEYAKESVQPRMKGEY